MQVQVMRGADTRLLARGTGEAVHPSRAAVYVVRLPAWPMAHCLSPKALLRCGEVTTIYSTYVSSITGKFECVVK